MIIRNLLLTIIALLVTGCMTVVPTQLPPEGTTATTTSEVRTVTRTITTPPPGMS